MISLYEKDTNTLLGTISEAQLQFLKDQLEEESYEDQDYAITAMLLDAFEGDAADPELVALLRKAIGDREEMVITWQE